jgi:hypothetical protein
MRGELPAAIPFAHQLQNQHLLALLSPKGDEDCIQRRHVTESMRKERRDTAFAVGSSNAHLTFEVPCVWRPTISGPGTSPKFTNAACAMDVTSDEAANGRDSATWPRLAAIVIGRNISSAEWTTLGCDYDSRNSASKE